MTAGIKANSDGSAAIQVGGTDVIGLGSTGNINFPVSGQRITGDFTNATLANRVMFQTSTTNGNTVLSLLPNGTSVTAAIDLYSSSSDQANSSILRFVQTSTDASIRANISGTGTYLPMTFYTGGSERMRIDTSGNVGIGTTGNLNYSSRLKVLAPSNGSVAEFYTPGNTYKSRINLTNDFSGAGIGSDSGALVFYANDATTERMRLDSAGNLGLGVTPSAWVSTSKALTVRSTGSGIEGSIANSGATNAISLVSNGYYNAGWKYVYSSGSFSAGRYDIEGAGHSWHIAAAGTAGNAITFTQAMTLDASGRLGIATTNPSVDLEIGANTSTTRVLSVRYSSVPLYLSGGFDGTFALNTFSSNGYANATGSGASWSSFSNAIYGASAVQLASGTSGADIRFLTAAAVNTAPTERVRIDASGFTQFNSNLVMPYQGAPTSKAAAATLSGAELITGILNTTGTTYTITLPTGTNIEGALTWVGNNVSLDWYVINTASGTITIGANGNTTLGSLTIATGTSAHFRIRRTAANTFTVYRL